MDVPGPKVPEPQLDEKVAFLARPESYAEVIDSVTVYETHMSFVFLAGETALKLKKPVSFSYLDFSTLERREAACRAELALNRRLARPVYRGVVPLVQSGSGLAIGGDGRIVDWLVVMKRLDHGRMLDRAISEQRLQGPAMDRVSDKLTHFYRSARRSLISPSAQHAQWQRDVALNNRILLDPRLGLPPGVVRRIDLAQRRFLRTCRAALAVRVSRRWIVDGHGDLRPEHIWLGSPVEIIDCLEFNTRLRQVDPFDEIAHLSVECERLGSAWAGERIRFNLMRALRDGVPEALYRFYRCYRATLRARLAIAHLLEPNPRTPEKWPRLANDYLRIAVADAIRIEALLRTPAGRRVQPLRARDGLLLQSVRPRAT